jgi:hypothetical protein
LYRGQAVVDLPGFLTGDKQVVLAQQGIDLVDAAGRGVLDGEDGEIYLARQQRADGLAECAVARQVAFCPPGGQVLSRSCVALCVR